MGVRVGEVLVATAQEIRSEPGSRRQGRVASWDVAALCVRRRKRVDIYMMNANEARSVIALLERALAEAPPEAKEGDREPG